MTRYFAGTVPKFVSKQYDGGARAFKAAKRRQLKMVLRELSDLRTGCAFFPCGSGPVDKAAAALEEIRQSISLKGWGR